MEAAQTAQSPVAPQPTSPKENGHVPEQEQLVNGHVEVNGDVIGELEKQAGEMSLQVQPELELHKVCAEGKLDEVRAILSQGLDALETLDMATGCTPIVLAIRNNHPEVVRELLTAGAIVPPPGLTNDPVLLSLLYPQPMYMPQYMGQHMPPQDYYGQFFPGQDGQRGYMPYPQKESPNGTNGNGQAQNGANLPPAEVAKTIPCRNFPNCKYGNSCVFYHPRPAPAYYPMANGYEGFVPFPPNMSMPYYQPFPGQIPEQQHQNSASPSQDNQDTQHQSHDQSQIQSPVQQPTAFVPFQPNVTSPQQSQFGLSPLSPSTLGTSLPPIPPPEVFFATSPPNGALMPPMNGYVPNGMPRRQSLNQFGGPGPKPYGHSKKPSFSNGGPRPWVTRSSAPNGNLGSWKDGNPPPCAFFSQGKCRNGEYCKFPHLDAEGNDCRHPDVVRGLIAPLPTLSRQRGMRMGNYGYDPRQQPYLPHQSRGPAPDLPQPSEELPNGDHQISQSDPVTPDPNTPLTSTLPSSVPPKPISATVPNSPMPSQIARSASQPGVARVHANGVSSRSHSPAPSNVSFPGPPRRTSRPPPGPGMNGGSSRSFSAGEKSASTSTSRARQRVPGADEFPALGGASGGTSPAEKHQAQFGKTAAQVLSAPAPIVVKTQKVEEEVEDKADDRSLTMESDHEPDTVIISHKPSTPAPPPVASPKLEEPAPAVESKRPSSSSAASASASAGMSFASVASAVAGNALGGSGSPPVEPSPVALKA